MNILIVEDARDQRMMLSVVLKKRGHQVLEAESGPQALELLKDHPEIRVIISDWIMPGMDGMALCEAIRQSDSGHYIYFILLTGQSDHKAVVEGIERGADDFLSKPVDFDELDARLKAGIRIIQLKKVLEQKIQIIEQDLEAAATTQRHLLCQPAQIQGIQFDWLFQPSRFLGGDMFGYHALDNEHIGFYQLDVAGHGMPSALFSFTLSHILSEAGYGGSILKDVLSDKPFYQIRAPERVLASLNEQFQGTVDAMMYFTMIYGVINSVSGEVTLAQAGHPQPLWLRSADRTVTKVAGAGVPVGMMPDMTYSSETIHCQPGDRLLLYSDGITECENAEGELFGEQRLMDVLAQGFDDSVSDLKERIEAAVIHWHGNNSFDDDVTFLVLDWQS